MQYEQAIKRINAILQKARHLAWRDGKSSDNANVIGVEDHMNHIREASQNGWDPSFAETYVLGLERQVENGTSKGVLGFSLYTTKPGQ